MFPGILLRISSKNTKSMQSVDSTIITQTIFPGMTLRISPGFHYRFPYRASSNQFTDVSLEIPIGFLLGFPTGISLRNSYRNSSRNSCTLEIEAERKRKRIQFDQSEQGWMQGGMDIEDNRFAYNNSAQRILKVGTIWLQCDVTTFVQK